MKILSVLTVQDVETKELQTTKVTHYGEKAVEDAVESLNTTLRIGWIGSREGANNPGTQKKLVTLTMTALD